MRKLHCPVPVITNAHHNRLQASRLLKAGFTAAKIAAAFPRVWRCSNNKLGQRYDSFFAEEPELLETSVMMSTAAVDRLIEEKE